MCPLPGWDRVNWSAKNWGGLKPPKPPRLREPCDEFQKSLLDVENGFHTYFMQVCISEIFKRLKFHDDCLSYMDIFSLPSYALKKPSWNFNFLHIFNIAASNRHETGCQMSARVFVALFDTIDLSWDCMKYHVAGFGNRNSIFRMKVVCNFGRSKLKKIKHTLIGKGYEN